MNVLSKAGRVLSQLGESSDLTARELSIRLGEPRPTVHRLLQELAGLGFVERGPRRGTYRLGLELFRLGSLAALRIDVREAAKTVMEEIHQTLEETVYLVIRRQYEAVCIDRIEGLHIRAMFLQLGGSLPLHLGAGPRAMLAFLSRAYWDEYFATVELTRLTPQSPTTTGEVVALLEDTLRTGYAISDGDVTVGMGSVGAPIFDGTGQVAAALSVGGLTTLILEDPRRDQVVELVSGGARRISEAMGYRPA
ncbi:MAG: IclR family transcriptional regulator [Candidatus Dormibacteria bacterium]|jgi:DNA-binding IclR family transcriptional regulator